MDFVDLDRLFAPIKKDTDVTLEWGPNWGRKYGGWLNWGELLERKRVALLAEALSGKTQELQHRAETLQAQGKYAFFVRIEDIVDDCFEGALSETETASFLQWKSEKSSDAWFFLDSVDEARLNNKHLETALNKFSKEVQLANLSRAHVVVSCRASDWRGKADREAFEKRLPYPSAPSTSTEQKDPDEALLAPIFDRTEKTRHTPEKPPEPHPADLLVVQLAPLTNQQKSKLAVAAGITDVQAFLEAVNTSGLDAMTERPGDLIDLVGYWKENSAFGTLAQMTEEGIRRKLREENTYRVDASTITFERAREGAERLAAALVLGKTFTIKAPAQEADLGLAAGALDLSELLPDWRQDEINALLRRGLFSPATYGRVRFHHRTSQEYLAACWLQRLLHSNCPLDEVRRLLFVELYGIRTVRPALRAVAAWLSLWQPILRDEIVKCEPVSLITYGDPKSLPLDVRKELLASYATLDSCGSLNVELIDYRAAWMFSNPELGDAVRQAWGINERSDFRLRLLQFIEEGPIASCADLARAVALDESQSQYHRIVAARALAACEDTAGLEALANQVRAAPDRLNARLAPGLALILFPDYLAASDLIDLIDRSEPARPFQSEGFARHLAKLHSRARNRGAQRQLAFEVAELYLAKPHVDEDAEVSRRHVELSHGLAELALAELSLRREGDIEAGLVRLLMAIERAQAVYGDSESLTQLRTRVQKDKALNRALMWADAQMGILGRPRTTPPTRFWQIGPFTGRALWSIDISDISWLTEDCRVKSELHDRQVAFSAIFSALNGAGMLADRHALLEELAARDPALKTDLEAYEAPPATDEYEAEHEANRRKREEQQRRDKQSWIDFRDTLQANPCILDAPGALESWQAGLFRLHHLTHWVKSRAQQAGLAGPRHWHFLCDAFGEAVAEHYVNAMRQVWRIVKPERPKYHSNGSYTTKHVSLLAIDSLAIDSAASDWESRLTDQEAELALRHGCLVGKSADDWFDRVVRARPEQASKVIRSAVTAEYKSEGARSDLLAQVAYNETAARAIVTKRVFELLKISEPVDDATLERVLRIIARGIDHVPYQPLKRLVLTRLQIHVDSACEKRAVEYLGLYANLAPDGLADQVSTMLVREADESEIEHAQRVQKWLGHLFAGEGRNGSATGALAKMSVTSLLRMVKLAYAQVPPQQDEDPHDDGSPSKRDAAESARRTLLNTLIARPGPEAFHALRELAADASFTGDALRLHELAHGKAETDGDHVAWQEAEVCAFGRNHTAPVKTGADLLRLVLAVLSDIAEFGQADASSRGVLARAADENEVQNWLAEQFKLRAMGRYHVHREPEVARRNEPDIVVSSTAADVEVAIEVKNANMGWTIKELEDTLHGQLARDYLRTRSRRHGILVVSLHKQRTWRTKGKVWSFNDLIAHLKTVASAVLKNETGAVEVHTVGIDATEPIATGTLPAKPYKAKKGAQPASRPRSGKHAVQTA